MRSLINKNPTRNIKHTEHPSHKLLPAFLTLLITLFMKPGLEKLIIIIMEETITPSGRYLSLSALGSINSFNSTEDT